MEKKKISVADLRKALRNVDQKFDDIANEMSDKVLLRAVPEFDLGMDSLDIAELSMELQKDCSITIPGDTIEEYNQKHRHEGFAKFLDMCNKAIA